METEIKHIRESTELLGIRKGTVIEIPSGLEGSTETGVFRRRSNGGKVVLYMRGNSNEEDVVESYCNPEWRTSGFPVIVPPSTDFHYDIHSKMGRRINSVLKRHGI